MAIVTLFYGDDSGLHDGPPVRSVEDVRDKLGAYAGVTGRRANPDQEFVEEVIRRRTALRLSAIKFGAETPYSAAYISMLENGTRFASEDAKAAIRATLDRLEQENRDQTT